MSENYTEGDLGEVFERATPLPLPVVSRLLDQLSNSLHHSDKNGVFEQHSVMLQRCREQLNVLEEACAVEEVVETLRTVRLRLRREVDATNAHLGYYLQQQQPPQGEGAEGDGGFILDLSGVDSPYTAERTGLMKPFEVVAVTTLMPKSAEEAVLLVPSLSRFDTEDLLEKVVRILEM